MPDPASVMVVRASSSCWRQSQRREWNTSPVRHLEWLRTIGGAAWISPITRATADSIRFDGAAMASLHGSGLSITPSKPRMRNCPQRVGKSASAILVTAEKGIARLYGSHSSPRGLFGEEPRLDLASDAGWLRPDGVAGSRQGFVFEAFAEAVLAADAIDDLGHLLAVGG